MLAPGGTEWARLEQGWPIEIPVEEILLLKQSVQVLQSYGEMYTIKKLTLLEARKIVRCLILPAHSLILTITIRRLIERAKKGNISVRRNEIACEMAKWNRALVASPLVPQC